MKKQIRTFQVFPNIPHSLAFLETLSRNLWWCWHMEAVELFRRVNPRLWGGTGGNPLLFSTYISQEQMERAASDKSFLAHLEQVRERFEAEVSTPLERKDGLSANQDVVAYFSMEFGIHESLPLFAGGLGVLAGDHLKAASDLSLPLVAVGLLYRQGYFRQYLDNEGWQQEEFPDTNLYHLPIRKVRGEDGKKLIITIPSPDGDIKAAAWKVQVGRIPLYLMDTDLGDNSQHIRNITARLYDSDPNIRMKQEVLLGIGGIKMLEALNIIPSVCHMNEGHCAFAGLERLTQEIGRNNIDLKTAMEVVKRSTVFTTHTPVAAGHDEFTMDMVKPLLDIYAGRLGVDVNEVASWGRVYPENPDSPFSMAVLALNMSNYCNGVSRLHGKVARRMWNHVWSGLPVEEVPISHVTNGVHIPSWLSFENATLFERYLGPEWHLHSLDRDLLDGINDIYDEELWRAHEMNRTRLIRTCRELMVRQFGRRSAPKSVMREAETVLDQDALTIAFARRFATYKRANLLLHDIDRLEALLKSEKYPIQFIFAGKAHPKDNEGKELIRRLVHFSQRTGMAHRFIFLEDYDMHLARHMVRGADVWLNNPRRPFEACGTSGMKAAVNGVLNISILDGWWDEGYAPERGWCFGGSEDEYPDPNYQDVVDSAALYNVLENEVIPCFYERKGGGVPVRWVRMMKESIKMTMKSFCSHKMVEEYEKRFYLPAAHNHARLLKDNASEARRIQARVSTLKSKWNQIKIELPQQITTGPFRVGNSVALTTKVFLGELSPDDVDVELYFGEVRTTDDIESGFVNPMNVKEDLGNSFYLYETTVNLGFSGRYGYTARVTPKGDTSIKYIPKLITWAESSV